MIRVMFIIFISINIAVLNGMDKSVILSTKQITAFYDAIENISKNDKEAINLVSKNSELAFANRPYSTEKPFTTLIDTIIKDNPAEDTMIAYYTLGHYLIKYNLDRYKYYPASVDGPRALYNNISRLRECNPSIYQAFFDMALQENRDHKETQETIFKALTGNQKTLLYFLKMDPFFIHIKDKENNTLMLALIKNGGLENYKLLFSLLIKYSSSDLFFENKLGEFPVNELSTYERNQKIEAYKIVHTILKKNLKKNMYISDTLKEKIVYFLSQQKYSDVRKLILKYPELCFVISQDDLTVEKIIKKKYDIISSKGDFFSLKKTIELLVPSEKIDKKSTRDLIFNYLLNRKRLSLFSKEDKKTKAVKNTIDKKENTFSEKIEDKEKNINQTSEDTVEEDNIKEITISSNNSSSKSINSIDENLSDVIIKNEIFKSNFTFGKQDNN